MKSETSMLLSERLCTLIGQYAVECSSTKGLAPSGEFADVLKQVCSKLDETSISPAPPEAVRAVPDVDIHGQPRIYPCRQCGVLRSKGEGGTTFTVCDGCWDLLNKPHVDPKDARIAELESSLAARTEERDQAVQEREEAWAVYTETVRMVAENRLEGYRSLGERLADAENRCDSLQAEVAREKDRADRYVRRYAHRFVAVNYGTSNMCYACYFMRDDPIHDLAALAAREPTGDLGEKK